MTLILLHPASTHDKHNTHYSKTKHTTHPAPGDMSTTTHHSSRSTAAPMSSLPLPPHFCSAMIVVAPLLRCAIQSAAAVLRPWVLLHFPTSPPSITFHPYHPPPAHQHHYSWLDCFMLLVVVFLPRVIRYHSPHMQKKNSMPPLSTT